MVINLNYSIINNTDEITSNYEKMIEDLIRVVKEELSLIVRNMLVYGSFAKLRQNFDLYGHYFVPGESDIDIIIVINPNPSGDSTEQLQTVVEALNSIIFEPIYAPYLDLAILESDIDLPNPVGENFNLLHLHSASITGEILFGKENHLKTYQFTVEELKHEALTEIHKCYSDLKNAIIHRDMYKTYELFWMGVDAVLNAALTYANYFNFKSSNNLVISKREVADFFTSHETELNLNLITTINDVIEFTLEGAPNIGQFEFFLECSRFCRALVSILKS